MLAKDIVNKLLTKFESSKVFSDPSSKRKIELKLEDAFFEGLRNGSEDLDVALETLERQGFCQIKYQDDYLERIILKTDRPSIDAAYDFTGRSNPKDRLVALKEYFASKANSDSEITRHFAQNSLKALEQGKPNALENAYGTLEDIKTVVSCIETMERMDSDVSERVFSSNLLGDSKKFALYRGKIAKVLRDYSEMTFEEDEDPIEAYGVIQNRTYAFIKGPVVISVGDENINLGKYGHELALSDEIIESMEIIAIDTANLFTIENLTSFNEFPSNDGVIVYLGGFHNSVKRKLLQKIYTFKPTLKFFHYGDIDAGGFYILNHLREKTGIPFVPFMMDKDTLIRYETKTKPLTRSDTERLAKMGGDTNVIDLSKSA